VLLFAVYYYYIPLLLLTALAKCKILIFVLLARSSQQPISVDKFLSTKPLRKEVSTRQGPGGMKLSYMGGDVITKTLNEGKFPAVFSEFQLIESAKKLTSFCTQ